MELLDELFGQSDGGWSQIGGQVAHTFGVDAPAAGQRQLMFLTQRNEQSLVVQNVHFEQEVDVLLDDGHVFKLRQLGLVDALTDQRAHRFECQRSRRH